MFYYFIYLHSKIKYELAQRKFFVTIYIIRIKLYGSQASGKKYDFSGMDCLRIFRKDLGKGFRYIGGRML